MRQDKKINRQRARRKARVRKMVRGTAEKPRLSVFRSNRHLYAQLIDDTHSKTIAAASSHSVKGKTKKTDAGKQVGYLLAEAAKKAGISVAVFDRGSYRYHGRLKAFVEAAREAGLKI